MMNYQLIGGREKLSLPHSRQRHLLRLTGIVLMALTIRVAYAMLATDLDPVLRKDPLHGDAVGYHILALNLLQGLGFTWDGQVATAYRVPGYPAFIAAIYAITGTEPYFVRLIQAILGALTCLPIYAVADRFGGERVAVLAVLGFALHPIALYMTGWLYSETLFLLLLWTGVWLLIRTLDGGKLHDALWTSITFGLTALIRPEVVLFLPLLLLTSWLLRAPWQSIKILIAMQILMGLVILPWTVRNLFTQNAFVALTTSTGSNFYAGNNSESNGGSAWSFPIAGLSEKESDEELGRRALAWIQANPAEFLRLLPKKLFKFFSPIAMETNDSNFLGRLSLPIHLAYSSLLLLAVWGGVIGRRDWSKIVLWVLVLCYTLTALIFYGGTRVSLPIVPVLVIFIAAGLVQLWDSTTSYSRGFRHVETY